MKKVFVPFFIILFISVSAIYACTVFKVSKGKYTFFCNNEDSPDAYSIINFIPAGEGKYGRFFMYFPNDPDPRIKVYPQGGMNEQGLVFDITATPLKEQQQIVFVDGTPVCNENLMEKVLSECGTVSEAIQLIEKYQAPEFGLVQILVADKNGDSAVFGVGKDNRLAVNRSPNAFQVLTNFSLVNPENSVIYPCYRYDTVTEMIRDMDELSLDYLRSILSITHLEGLAATVYSNIYDLRNGDIYFYYYHNFETAVKLNLQEELKKGKHSVEMSSLFPRKVFAQIAMEQLVKYVDSLRNEIEELKKK